MSESEDHIASLCEVMRFLIAGDDAGISNLAAQRRFFDEHLRGWVDSLCTAIEAHPERDFYAALARFTRDFFAARRRPSTFSMPRSSDACRGFVLPLARPALDRILQPISGC